MRDMVKEYADHESSVFENIARLRGELRRVQTTEEKIKINDSNIFAKMFNFAPEKLFKAAAEKER